MFLATTPPPPLHPNEEICPNVNTCKYGDVPLTWVGFFYQFWYILGSQFRILFLNFRNFGILMGCKFCRISVSPAVHHSPIPGRVTPSSHNPNMAATIIPPPPSPNEIRKKKKEYPHTYVILLTLQ